MPTGLPLVLRVNPKFQFVDWDTDKESRVFRKRVKMSVGGVGDFNVAATTANLDLLVPGGMIIERAYLSLITAFSGGSVSAATLSIGTTGSPATYLGATNVFTGATASGNVTVAAGAGLNGAVSGASTPTAVGTIRVQMLTTTANANALVAGAADIYLVLRALSFKTT
jgi:hypothetical protein